MQNCCSTSVKGTSGWSSRITIRQGSRPMPSSPSQSARGFDLGLNERTFALAATAILLFGAAMWCARGPNVEKTDFSLTYVGARIVHQGMGHRLYDAALQKKLRDSLFEHPSPLLF